jgi:hypothetical protein
MNGPRILLWDTENFPAQGYFYEFYKEGNIVKIIEPPFLLSYSAKWLGEDKVITKALCDYKGYRGGDHDDYRLVEDLAKLLDSADYYVAHNGDKHDIRMTNTRLVCNGLGPLIPRKTIDTLKIARSKFNFLNNKLDSLGSFLGVGRKLPNTGFDLWERCERGERKAWQEMKAYNAQDVLLLEKVYLKLRPFATTHPNLNLITRASGCPKCGSTHLQKRGFSYRLNTEAQRYQCVACGAWSEGKQEKIDSRVTVR